jgi:hypothetical protein
VNHLTYQLAVARPDDLLRAAAEYRAAHVTSVVDTVSSVPSRHALAKARLARLRRLLTTLGTDIDVGRCPPPTR